MSDFMYQALPNTGLFGNLVCQVKGYRSINDFAFDIGMSPRVLQRYIRNETDSAGGKRKTKIDESLIDTIIEKGEKKCISKDQFMASVGALDIRYVEALRKRMLGDKADYLEKDYNSKNFTPSSLSPASIDPDEVSPSEINNISESGETKARKYIDFLTNLETLVKELEQDIQETLYKNAYSVFEMKGGWELLKKYCKYKKDENTAKKYYKEHEKEDIPEALILCHDYEVVLKMLFGYDD